MLDGVESELRIHRHFLSTNNKLQYFSLEQLGSVDFTEEELIGSET